MEKILFIFKDKPWYLNHIKNKFSKKFSFRALYLNNYIQNTRTNILQLVNNFIIEEKIKKVFFDIDYTSFIDKNFVSQILSPKKILYSLDSEENFEKIKNNLEVFSHFLLAEPKITKNIKEKINYLFFPLECDEKIFFKKKIKKKYDIFFFGETRPERIKFLKSLDKLKLKKKILLDTKNSVEIKKINILMNQSRIVLNFSEGINKNSRKKFDQFKGRIIMSGLSGTFCLSQDCESKKLIFKKNYPTFSNTDQMLQQINLLTSNKKKLNKISKEFYNSCKKYSDKLYISEIIKFLNKRKKCRYSDLEFKEIINIFKISSKKNTTKIYLKNVLETTRYYFKNLNFFKILNLLNIYFIAMIYLILTIKNNARRYKRFDNIGGW